MPTKSPPRKSSRSASKRNGLLPPVPSRPKLGLAVDTSFSRHRGHTPQQVFPYESKTQDYTAESLLEAKAPRKNSKSNASGGLKEQLENKVYVPPASGFSLQPPPLHKRVNGLRPSPLDLGTEVSPSDRAIEIGIAVPSANLSQHTDSPDTSVVPQRQASQKYGHEFLTTPSIVVTPAKENFEEGLIAPLKNYRPTSSVYSRYTNCVPKRQPRIEGTPPVPPLPLSAEQSAVSSHSTTRDSNLTEFEEQQTPPSGSKGSSSGNSSSITPIEEGNEEGNRLGDSVQRSVWSKRRSSQAGVPTPRRSKGWWNILSPLSASSKSGKFSSLQRSSLLPEEDEEADDRPMLSAASDMGTSRQIDFDMDERPVADSGLSRNFSRRTPSEFRFGASSSVRSQGLSSPSQSSRLMVDDEPQSAPPTGGQFRGAPYTGVSDANSFGFDGRRMPQRSDTAPGALDFGNADEVNIYRAPDTGAASSYFDSSRRFPSGVPSDGRFGASRGPDFDELPDGWHPRQSVADGYGCDSRGMRNTEFYGVPNSGAAAPYYDSSRNFPSLVPDGAEAVNRRWSPSQSCYRAHTDAGPAFEEGELMRSPSEFHHDDRSVLREWSPHPDDDDDDYPATAHTAGPSDGDRTMRESTFEGFSGTYPPAKDGAFFSTPSENELHGGTPAQPLTARSERLSHMTATPILESAQTATYMGPLSANGEPKEVDLNSLRTRTPTPTGYPLASATMASRDAPRAEYGDYAMPPLSEKTTPSYPPSAQHSRNGSEGLGISDGDSERALFPPQHTLFEKRSIGSETLDESSTRGDEDDREPGVPWYRRFFWLLLALIIAALAGLAVLLFIFIPRHHHHDVQTQAQWLSLTGYPPLPTGVTTVVSPKTVRDVSGCVQAQDMWSCSTSSGGGQSGQPNFTFKIRFRNGTSLPSNETAVAPSNNSALRRDYAVTARASGVVKRGLFSNPWYASSPKPPSANDQIFLGQTTDKNAEPYNGEETPFYISLLNASESANLQQSKLRKRDTDFQYPYPTPTTLGATSEQASSRSATSISFPASITSSTQSSHSTESPDSNNAYPYPNQSTGLPSPGDMSNSGHASGALYPLPSSQPLRLFNRGQTSEHYGFYTYFDRMIYVANVPSSNNFSTNTTNTVPISLSICTWSQTRFLVQIWTQKSTVTTLNGSDTANDMTAPGSFPYSVTVTLDRHGGDGSKKGLYCYNLDESQHVLENTGRWIPENRAFDGTLVNPAVVPVSNSTAGVSKRSNDDVDVIDGGTGGCGCQWQN